MPVARRVRPSRKDTRNGPRRRHPRGRAPRPRAPATFVSPGRGAPMTNRKLLQAPRQMLNEVDRQRLFLLRVESAAVPCPACKRPVDAFEAAGIDLDEY